MKQRYALYEAVFWLLCVATLALGIIMIFCAFNIIWAALMALCALGAARLYSKDEGESVEERVRTEYQDLFEELKKEYLQGYLSKDVIKIMVENMVNEFDSDKYRMVKVRVIKQLEEDTFRVS